MYMIVSKKIQKIYIYDCIYKCTRQPWFVIFDKIFIIKFISKSKGGISFIPGHKITIEGFLIVSIQNGIQITFPKFFLKKHPVELNCFMAIDSSQSIHVF